MESGCCSLSLPLVAIVLALLSEFATWAGDSGPGQHSGGETLLRGGGAEDHGEKWQRQGQGQQGRMAEMGMISWPNTDSRRGGERQLLLFKFPSLLLTATCFVFLPHYHQVAQRGWDATVSDNAASFLRPLGV